MVRNVLKYFEKVSFLSQNILVDIVDLDDNIWESKPVADMASLIIWYMATIRLLQKESTNMTNKYPWYE